MAGGLYFGFGKNNFGRNDTNLETNPDANNVSIPIELDEVFAEPVVYSALNRLYSREDFSFKYPDGFKATTTPAETGEAVVVENANGSGFQIFSSPFDEPGPITPERIWQDQPDMEINNPRNANLDGVKALVFNGYDEALGETFEVWTVHNGKFYQIAGPKTTEQLIIETLEKWEWK